MAVELDLKLSAHRQLICRKLKEGIPQLLEVQPHVGTFGAETLKRFSQRMPSARVSFMGVRKIARNNVGQLIGPAMYAVFVLTKDPYPNEAYAPGVDLAERVADFIDMNTFGSPNAACAEVTDIEPIYSETVDQMGACLVAVMFTQEVTFGRSRHEMEEHELYPTITDPEVQAAGWPGDLRVTETSQTGVAPGYFPDRGYGPDLNDLEDF